MLYLLIDNCSLRDLIDNWGYSKVLPDLENLISTNRVKFVTHKLIIEEWDKHRISWQKQKEKKLLGFQNTDTNKEAHGLIPGTGLVHADHLQVQVSRIDFLLHNASIILETPPLISSEFAERYRKRLAPLHKKRNSLNDWEIIGSFCHYGEINAIRELYFLSSNNTDFGDEVEKNSKIHPSLQERFNKLKIHYFKDYTDFFTAIKDDNRISIELIPYTLVPNEKFAYHNTIKKTILESLCYLFKELYAEIDFIPTQILKKYYPFSSSEKSDTYYNNFTMHAVSENMSDFFAGISVKNNEIVYQNESLLTPIRDYKNKVAYVLKKLTANLVFHIAGEKSRKKVCTHNFNTPFCDCIRCSFNRFEFDKTFKNVNTPIGDPKEKLKQAYIHYQLGNYQSANRIYEEIISTALEGEKFMSYFIAKYNQNNLSNFLRNFFTNKRIDYALVDKLEKIDPLEEAVKLKTFTDYELLSYIAKQDFFNEAFQRICNTKEKIVTHYRSQLNNGWASNEFIWELIGTFAELEYFLNANYIIYDCFSNFEKVFEQVVEGLFASYAISEKQNERFEKFDDYWVLKFLLYGKRETIVRMAYRYHLKDIRYEPGTNEKETFLTLFSNLVTGHQELQSSFRKFADKDNLYFDLKFDAFFENALTLAAILYTTREFLKQFIQLLIPDLKLRTKLSHSVEEAIGYFIRSKGKSLTVEDKYELLNYTMNNDNCKYSDLLRSAVDSFGEGELDKITDEDLDTLMKHSVNECEKCKGRHDIHLFTMLFEKANTKQKKIIKKQAQATLENKFDFEIFYLSTIYKIVPLNIKQLNTLIKEFKHNKQNRTFRSVFSGAYDFQNDYLDKIINLCFALGMDTTVPKFKNIATVHPYYEWLLDMEHFNYENFDPEWVLKYGTTHYYKKMSQSEKLKEALRLFLSDKFHEGIERLLLKITNFYN